MNYNFENLGNILIIDGDNYFYRLFSILKSLLKKELGIEDITQEHVKDILAKSENNFRYFDNLIKYNHYSNIFFVFDTKTGKEGNYKIIKEINENFDIDNIDYKGQRIKNNEFIEYKKYIQNILYIKGYPIFLSHNNEADDVIATLVKKINENNNYLSSIDILTTDKDIYQLLSENVKIVKGINKKDLENKISFGKYKIELFNKSGLKLKEAKDIIYIKAIVGDKSDNIPGIKGIAEKTLAKELNKNNNNLLETDIYKKHKELINAFIPLIQLNENIPDKDIELKINPEPSDNKVQAYLNKVLEK